MRGWTRCLAGLGALAALAVPALGLGVGASADAGVGVGASPGAAAAVGGPASRCGAAPGRGLTLANIAAAGPRLVAVGSNGLIATSSAPSSAPSSWTVRVTPVRHDLRGVTWTGTRWVVVGDVGTILSSVDGAAWSAAGGIPSAGLRAIAARAGLVVAAGSAGTLLSSADGLTWSRLVAVGDGGVVLRSLDGGTRWRRILGP